MGQRFAEIFVGESSDLQDEQHQDAEKCLNPMEFQPEADKIHAFDLRLRPPAKTAKKKGSKGGTEESAK